MSSLKDLAASEDKEVAAFNSLLPQEFEGIKDVAFKTNPRACENAIKRLKAIAFSAGGLMASEQQLKLEELLHLFRMESQNIFEKTWKTPLTIPFQNPQRKYIWLIPASSDKTTSPLPQIPQPRQCHSQSPH